MELEERAVPNATYFNLSGGNLTQNWSSTSSLLTADSWANIPSIEGYLGDGMTPTATSTDPQSVTTTSTSIDLVNASTATSSTGGVHEINDDVVALQGSGTAVAPYLAFYLNMTGRQGLTATYTLRELDSTTASQLFALQYRTATTGPWTNVPVGAFSTFVSGGGFATAGNQTVTLSNIALPAAVNGKSQVQVRIMTHDAAGSDAMVGIDDITFASSPDSTSPPTVTTPTSASVTTNSATLGGNVTADGGNTVTERGVVFALTSDNADPAIGGTGVTKVAGTGTTGVFTVDVSGLSASSGYSFKAYATNGAGTSYSAVATFSTASPVAPTVTSPTATLVTTQSATLGANVTSDGFAAITERGFVYAKTSDNANPQIGGTGITQATVAGTTGAFTADITGLTSNTGYSFRAYAINSAGTTYTAPVTTFTTQSVAVAPTVSSPTATAITDTLATLGGTVDSDGGAAITERGVVYALTTANANPVIGGSGVTKITAAGTTGAFTANATGLNPSSGYSYRAYAINSAGTTYTSAATFSTTATPTAPTVTLPTSTAVTDMTATLGGTVDSDNGAAITDRGIVYSLTSANANPQIGGTGVTMVTAVGTTGLFTVPVTGLTATSGYTFRAYATNSVGTTYSANATFTTTATPVHYDVNSAATAEIRLLTGGSVDTVGNASGIRVFSGATSTLFFNVEGTGTGNFQEFAVADFLPIANPSVTSLGNVTLTFAEAPAAFSAAGNVQFYLATVNDANLIDAVNNPNVGVPAAVAGQNGLAGIDPVFAPLPTLLGTGTYVLGSGLVVSLNLTNSQVNTAFLNAIHNGTPLRLLAAADPATPNVAFTGAGSTGVAPKLSYDTFLPTGNPPAITVTNPTVTVNEGQPATNDGTVNDTDGLADIVSVTSSVGSVTYTPGTGTYTWNDTPADSTPVPTTVTLTVADTTGNMVQTTFSLSVNNVAPTATGVSGPATLVEGATGSYTIAGLTDVAADLGSLHYSFGLSPAELAANYASASTANTFNYTPTDNGSATVYAMVFDKDGGVNSYQMAVTISNAVPTATSITGPTSLTASATPANYTLGGVADPSSVDTTSLKYSFALSAAGLAAGYDAATAVNTFAQSFPTAGSFTVFARTYDKDGGISATQMLNVTVTGSGTPSVTGFTVNDGAAQRSRITTLTVTFDAPVLAADFNTLGAIQLQRTGVSSIPTGTVGDLVQTGPAAANHITVAQGTAASLVLTFDNNEAFNTASAGVESGSLSDGYWKLIVGGYSSATGDLNLRRLYGDSTSAANGTVNTVDLTAFGNAFNSSTAAFDFNNDGVVNTVDLTAFGNRFGNVL